MVLDRQPVTRADSLRGRGSTSSRHHRQSVTFDTPTISANSLGRISRSGVALSFMRLTVAEGICIRNHR